MWAASKLKFTLKIAAPASFQPDPHIVAKVGPHVQVTDDLERAATNADVLYTDVWVSMGKEEEAAYRIAQLGGYHINKEVVSLAKPNALIMHCLPAYRGKEITEDVFEANAQTIFDQAENRLHAQKAVLSLVAKR